MDHLPPELGVAVLERLDKGTDANYKWFGVNCVQIAPQIDISKQWNYWQNVVLMALCLQMSPHIF